jgi:hypothetical protein
MLIYISKKNFFATLEEIILPINKENSFRFFLFIIKFKKKLFLEKKLIFSFSISLKKNYF